MAYDKFQNDVCTLFLDELKTPKKAQEILLYTLAGFDSNLREIKVPTYQELQLYSTRELVNRGYQYVKSMGVHSKLPFLYTNYGTGDIPQGFSRIGAVFGSIFIIHEGIKVENLKKEKSEDGTILHPFMLIFPNKRRIYYLDTKEERD